MLESFGLCSTIALFGKIYLLNFLILLFYNYTKIVINVIFLQAIVFMTTAPQECYKWQQWQQ